MDQAGWNVLEDRIYQLNYYDLSISDFEKWVYQSTELEELLSPDDYLELISLNYNDKFIRRKIDIITRKYVDYGKLETARVIDMLTKAKIQDKNSGEIIKSFYDMYCEGYYFLHDLGLGYGLSCKVPLKFNVDSWEELNCNEKEELVSSFYPQIIECIEEVLKWIDSKKIVLTGTKNELGCWEFVDYRTTEEKKSTILAEPKVQAKKKKWYRTIFL